MLTTYARSVRASTLLTQPQVCARATVLSMGVWCAKQQLDVSRVIVVSLVMGTAASRALSPTAKVAQAPTSVESATPPSHLIAIMAPASAATIPTAQPAQPLTSAQAALMDSPSLAPPILPSASAAAWLTAPHASPITSAPLQAATTQPHSTPKQDSAMLPVWIPGAPTAQTPLPFATTAPQDSLC